MAGFTRLLTTYSGRGDDLMADIPTVVVEEKSSMGYVVINRPYSMVQFLKHPAFKVLIGRPAAPQPALPTPLARCQMLDAHRSTLGMCRNGSPRSMFTSQRRITSCSARSPTSPRLPCPPPSTLAT